MSIDHELTIGATIKFRLGRNTIEATVLRKTEDGWIVRNVRTGNEIRIYNNDASIELLQAVEDDDGTPNPAPESGCEKPKEKNLSLLNAAALVLEQSQTPLNCKEMVAKAIELELWIPTGAKTPEQTLYSGIFREIKTCETPRFKKSETKKGSFEYMK